MSGSYAIISLSDRGLAIQVSLITLKGRGCMKTKLNFKRVRLRCSLLPVNSGHKHNDFTKFKTKDLTLYLNKN